MKVKPKTLISTKIFELTAKRYSSEEKNHFLSFDADFLAPVMN